MLSPGHQVELTVEKPAAGGRMIARHEGQVVLVLGAVPGERVLAQIERADRRLAFARVLEVQEPSPDRRPGFADPLCGGCVYSHIAYTRQLNLKSEIVADAFLRLGRLPLDREVNVAPSPEHAYRMRARLHVRGTQVGFYREGTHTLCSAEGTKQLHPEALASAQAVVSGLARGGARLTSVELTENLAGDQQALFLECESGGLPAESSLTALVGQHRLSGMTAWAPGAARLAVGTPSVSDPLRALTLGRAPSGELHRRPESFFQANRYLLPGMVASVIDAVPADVEVIDLYAGVGLFSLALAAVGRAGITAVEGDPASSADLLGNASQFPGTIRVMPGSVEEFVRRRPVRRAATVIVDPPRTGMSKQAMEGVLRLGADRIIYVSCDPPTMARDARRIVDAGHRLASLHGWDLFPNTPHVETVGIYDRWPGV